MREKKDAGRVGLKSLGDEKRSRKEKVREKEKLLNLSCLATV